MLKIIVAIIIVIVVTVVVLSSVKKNRKIEKMFLDFKGIIPIESLVLFSNKDLVKWLRNTSYYNRISIQFADENYFFMDLNCTDKEAIEKIESLQDKIIATRYEPNFSYNISDPLVTVMFDIWLDYAYLDNYYKMFRRRVAELYDCGILPKSYYNEIYRIFESNK